MKKIKERPKGAGTPSGHMKNRTIIIIPSRLILKNNNRKFAESHSVKILIDNIYDYDTDSIKQGHTLRDFINQIVIDDLELIIHV